ncbi:4232_t:CDS:2, partial [Acaulospora morrowiae]
KKSTSYSRTISDEVARIITDLLTTEPAYVNIVPPPYDAWNTYKEKVAKSSGREDRTVELSYPILLPGKLTDLLPIPKMRNRADLSN